MTDIDKMVPLKSKTEKICAIAISVIMFMWKSWAFPLNGVLIYS